MILELSASRILAPYLGTTIVVWTCLIGIILGSLSIGYFLGGKIADRYPYLEILSLIIFLSGIFIGLIVFVKTGVLFFINEHITDIGIGTILAILSMFTIPSILLGMVTPYAIKLKLKDLKSTGTISGFLYSISTIGSIFGTFFAGFLLIPYLGSTNILILLACALVLTSILVYSKSLLAIRSIFVFLFIISGFFFNYTHNINKKNGFIDIDTAYNRVWIFDAIDQKTQRPIRYLTTDVHGAQSIMFLDQDNDLVCRNTKFYRLAEHFNPYLKKALLVGAGGYSYPKDFLKKFPLALLDVVEIDPRLTQLSRKYFNLSDNPRLTIYHEDGRTFLNKTDSKYDVIFNDMFKSFIIPYQLTTKEVIQKMYTILNNQGVVLTNISASSIENDRGKFLRAEYSTYKSVFPQVYLFPVDNHQNGTCVQNIILAALKSKRIPSFQSKNQELNGYLQHLWKKEIKKDVPILTDDYAPVEHYMTRTVTTPRSIRKESSLKKIP